MLVPIESCRGASLNEQSYMRFARKHYRKALGLSYDQFLRELINLGVPLCTGSAIDRKVAGLLLRAGMLPSDHCVPAEQSVALHVTRDDHTQPRVSTHSAHHDDHEDRDDGMMYPMDYHHALLSNRIGASGDATEGLQLDVGDSGATDHLHDAALNDCLTDSCPATTSYQIADGNSIHGDMQGDLDVSVLNLDHQPSCPSHVNHTIHTTTVKDFGPSGLWSLEASFRDEGYDIHMCHGYHENDRSRDV